MLVHTHLLLAYSLCLSSIPVPLVSIALALFPFPFFKMHFYFFSYIWFCFCKNELSGCCFAYCMSCVYTHPSQAVMWMSFSCLVEASYNKEEKCVLWVFNYKSFCLFFPQCCCNWVSSPEPLDTPLDPMLPDCPRVSAGIKPFVYKNTSTVIKYLRYISVFKHHKRLSFSS